jgi:4-diphosphocytidyl-2-C-methyl-D-erythritol kinase
LNLYLNIIGKYPSGYHKLESIVERVSICDKIKIIVNDSGRIRLFSNDKKLQTPDNLCWKACALIKEKFKLPLGFDIYLTKNIPVGAGLGGGSSNAAFTFLGLNRLLELKLSKANLFKLGAMLGSDVNFFIAETRFAKMSGRGEKINPFKAKTFRHLVVWPGVMLSTKLVYQHTKAKLTKNLDNANIIRYALTKGDISLVKKSIFNALEKSAYALCPQIIQAKKFFEKKGIVLRVTGSGSALYALLDNNQQVNFNRLPANWKFFRADTF